MIKYLGSKRRLVPVLSQICAASGARTALDLFTGTTRVAQAFKAQGVAVTAVDTARYAHVFAQCYIEADAAAVDMTALTAAIAHLNGLAGTPGLRARHLQQGGAILPTVQRRPDRCRPRRHRP